MRARVFQEISRWPVFVLAGALALAVWTPFSLRAAEADDAQAAVAALDLARKAQAAADEDTRQELWDEFLDATGSLALRHPERVDLWTYRATAALELNRGKPAREAAQRLLAVRAPDTSVQAVLAKLHARGWDMASKVRTSLPPGPAAPAKKPGSVMRVGENGIKLHWIPPGKFYMGTSSSDPHGRAVTITRGFWLAETEITQLQWQEFMGMNPSNFQQDSRLPQQKGMTIIGDDRPVEQVSWTQARSYCARLNENLTGLGLVPAGYEVRLPTEAEWEYAARGGIAGNYPEDLGRLAWYDQNSRDITHDVAGKRVNPWGVYDMGGNVAEWCLDWFLELDSQESTDWAVLDPDPDATTRTRVIRGGSWLNVAARCQPAYRMSDDPNNTLSYVGFRIAIAPIAYKK